MSKSLADAATCVSLLLLALAALPSQASGVFVIDPANGEAPLGQYLDILEDSEGRYGVEDLADEEVAKAFTASTRDEPSFGFTDSTYWVRLVVRNSSDEAVTWYLESRYPLIDSIDIHVPDDEGYQVRRYGDHQPFQTRELNYRNIIMVLDEEPRSESTYYIRFNTSSSMIVSLKYWQPDIFLEKVIIEEITFGIFYGALLIMLIYNMIMYFVLKDVSYFYYVFFFLTWGLTQLSLNGLSFQFMWPDAIVWANINIPVLLYLALAAFNLWGRTSLATYMYIPALDRFFKLLIVVSLAGTLSSFVAPYAITIRVGTVLAGITALCWLFVAGLLSKQGQQSARFFFLALTLYFIGVILFSLKTLGVLPSNFVTNSSIQFGAFAALILFSLSTTDKILRTLIRSESLLEQEVEQRTRELMQEKQKSEEANLAKGRFLAYMSHEIRTPMNGILGMARFLAAEQRDEDQRKMAKIIAKSGNTLVKIVNDILDLSKLEAGQVKLESIPFSARDVIDDVMSIMRPLTGEKGLELKTDIDAGIPAILRGDPNRLEQILMNLSSNAIKFTETGSISIKLSLLEEDGNDACMEFAVTDTGKGMTRDAQQKLFTPYSQGAIEVARLHGGTGLGLFISRQLIHLMDSEITIDSKAGEGSTFRFRITLPIDTQTRLEDISHHDLASVEGFSLQPDRFLNILQIEDNETNRDVVERILRLHGHAVTSVVNGREALYLIERQDSVFDAIVTDRHMPVMDGLEVTQCIRRMSPPYNRIPIIGITASVIAHEVDQCYEAGMDVVLAKPILPSILLTKLATLTRDDERPKTDPAASTVLVVDDDATTLETARRQLEAIGISCSLFQDSRDALDSAKTIRYGLVMIDNSMPGLDGVAFTRALREHEIGYGRRTPVIIITGSAAADDREQYFSNGIDICLEKPVALERLHKALEQWIDLPENDSRDLEAGLARAAAEDTAAPVDTAMLGDILGTDNETDLLDVSRMFVEHFAGALTTLESALDKADRPAIRDAAHAARSAASSAAALPLVDLLQHLENESASSEMSQLQAGLQAVVKEFDHVRHTVTRWEQDLIREDQD